ALSLLRALTVQLAHAVSPALAELRVSAARDADVDAELGWLRALPHATAATLRPTHPAGAARAQLVVELAEAGDGASTVVALAQSESDVPVQCAVVVSVTGASAHVVRWPASDAAPGALRPHLLAREAAVRRAELLHRTATDDELLVDTGIPLRVA